MKDNEFSLLGGLRELLTHLARRRRLQGVAVLLLMLAGAFAELLTIGAVLPFLALVADPEASTRFPLLADLLELLGAEGRREAIIAIAALFCAIAVGAAVVRIVLTWASKKYVLRIGHDLSVSLYKRLLYQPYSFHTLHNSSTTLSGLIRVQNVVNQVLMPLVNMLTATIIAIFILTTLVFIDATVALGAAAAFGTIYVGVSIIARGRLQRNGQIIARCGPVHLKAAQEGLGGIRDVLIDQSQPVHLGKYARIDTQMRDAQSANALIGALPRFVIEGLGMVMIAGLALVLSRGEGGLATALPVLGALALGAQRLLPLLQQLYSGWTQLRGAHAIFNDVLRFLKLPLPADLAARRRIVPMPFEREIAFEDVSFRYAEEGPAVLRDINLRIPKGARIGFIGKTGSGKSTLIDLVMALLEPSSGTIRIDGSPLTGATIPSWQVQIAHVPQHIFLSDGTILENIAFGLPSEQIDEERVRQAARKADIDAFIEEQPNGYHTVIGERGTRLSGGQRQRIGIARALYKQSTVLILDEATSALDDATEASIIAGIDRLGNDITVLMIAHRLTTLRSCDVIYRLDKGAISGSGTYDEVVGSSARSGIDEARRAAL
jgi:ABC-type multidrug transport system fused ATPase/permease subunit